MKTQSSISDNLSQNNYDIIEKIKTFSVTLGDLASPEFSRLYPVESSYSNYLAYRNDLMSQYIMRTLLKGLEMFYPICKKCDSLTIFPGDQNSCSKNYFTCHCKEIRYSESDLNDFKESQFNSTNKTRKKPFNAFTATITKRFEEIDHYEILCLDVKPYGSSNPTWLDLNHLVGIVEINENDDEKVTLTPDMKVFFGEVSGKERMDLNKPSKIKIFNGSNLDGYVSDRILIINFEDFAPEFFNAIKNTLYDDVFLPFNDQPQILRPILGHLEESNHLTIDKINSQSIDTLLASSDLQLGDKINEVKNVIQAGLEEFGENIYQKNAFKMALFNPLSLIQGPPGTGKVSL